MKKGAQPATGSTKTNGSGGVVPPPGLNLPPPPGMVTAPAQPAIPNAADDPFGAMNAMAAVGKVQRAPEIVIVNDGKPVENVGTKSMGATIARIAIPAVAALVAGVAVGKIGTSAAFHNEGRADLQNVLGEDSNPGPSTVIGLKANLLGVQKVLDDWKTANEWKPSKAFETKLEAAVIKLNVESQKWFKDKSSVDAEIAGKIYAFYGGVAEVRAMFATHASAARDDDKTYTKAGKFTGLEEASKFLTAEGQMKDGDNAFVANDQNSQGFRYAVLIQVPTDRDPSPFGAKIVELGPPVCGGDTSPNTTGRCPDDKPLTNFAYRAEPSEPWRTAPPARSSNDLVAKSLVLTFPGGVRDSLVKGAGFVVSDAYYSKRLSGLYERIRGKPDPKDPERKPVGGLIDEGNKLESSIKTILDQKKDRFTFFM
ncbi:MAG: hypothetical protein KF773_19745 [Deltaproteobacteria bacterium]|nr:hypothetical protein [Deltaproteobacteria bacterium]MCW5806233.1 hypothetical protein [Deltaproteobacteria bacterium]